MNRNRNKIDTTKRQRSVFTFFSEALSELRKVTWPTRQDTLRLSLLVLLFATAIGLILGFIDIGFARLMRLLGA